MAERRMFAKTIVLSDDFLDLPMSTRCLYFTLSMLADDDGFINNPKSIMRQCGASADDMNVLISKRFVLTFESGVIVIKHWKIHNLIQKDRYKETKYLDEKATLTVDDRGAYTECIQTGYKLDTECIQNVSKVDTRCIQDVSKVEPQVRLGKSSLVKDSLVEGSGVEPTAATAAEVCVENSVENSPKVSPDDMLLPLGGTLGKGVVYLSNNQMEDLLNRIGIDGFNLYSTRLADFIIKNNAHVKNHYETILKWYEEDSKVGGEKA